MQTRCPACGTAFRITPDQLRVKSGRVRCGHCRAVFNSLAYLVEERKPLPDPLPPVAMPPEPEDSAGTAGDNAPEGMVSAIPAEQVSAEMVAQVSPLSEPVSRLMSSPPAPPRSQLPEAVVVPPAAEAEAAVSPEKPAVRSESGDDAPSQIDALLADLEGEPLPPPVSVSGSSGSDRLPEDDPLADPSRPPRVLELDVPPAEAGLADPAADDEPAYEPLNPPRQKPLWPFIAFAGVMSLLLTLQAGYHLRTELCNALPGLSPLYESLGIDVPLARQPELISLENSDLQADAGRGMLLLYATFKNRAAYPQAWPMLELTLTDERENIIARRSFSAHEYLARNDGQAVAQNPDAPFAAHAEISVRLWLEAREIGAAGYRVYLYYP